MAVAVVHMLTVWGRELIRVMDEKSSASLVRESLRTCGLRELVLPLGGEASRLARLERLFPLSCTLSRGETLFEQGSTFDSLYLVREGLVKSEIVAHGVRQVTGFHFPDELVGLDAFAGGAHPCRAVAVTSGEALRIRMRYLDELSSEAPVVARRLRRLMSREIAEGKQMLLVLGSMPTAQRVAVFLLSWAHRLNRKKAARSKLTLNASKADIASYIGLRHETLRRRLLELEQLGIIRIPNRNSVEIVDILGLAQTAGVYGDAATQRPTSSPSS